MAVRTKPSGAVKPVLGFPPPLVALLLLGVGLGIHFAFPARLLPEGWIQFVVAAPLFFLAVAVTARALKSFGSLGTDERYAEPTSAIVQDGPYARTRNPMFLGLVLIYLGVVVAVNTAWALVGLPVLIIWLHFGVIRREERFLEDRFGDEYSSYRRRVPRWIPRVASNK
jgi:protein-S-isoprenylcysteine O-methyltransferase Ste14